MSNQERGLRPPFPSTSESMAKKKQTKNEPTISATKADLAAYFKKLYETGKWLLPDRYGLSPADQAAIWEEGRDLFGIEPGTGTSVEK